jgi:hypothetical protein
MLDLTHAARISDGIPRNTLPSFVNRKYFPAGPNSDSIHRYLTNPEFSS